MHHTAKQLFTFLSNRRKTKSILNSIFVDRLPLFVYIYVVKLTKQEEAVEKTILGDTRIILLDDILIILRHNITDVSFYPSLYLAGFSHCLTRQLISLPFHLIPFLFLLISMYVDIYRGS